MYSPNVPEGDDDATEPVPGMGPADDPGFGASMRARTHLGILRRLMLVLVAAPVLILALVPLIVQDGRGRFGDAPFWLYLPLPLAAVVVAVVAPRVPRPLPPGLPPAQAARTALMAFRQAMLLRFALAEGVILLGLPLAVGWRAELVFVVAFACGWPLLLWLIVPTRANIERSRRLLEADGAESFLWSELLRPVPPPSTDA
ncbi:hypothetical protein K1Y72_13370 [Actinomadura sp. PM05-2]|uniref:MFS transporter n=2 Tax=Actinomadura parmotrematis TaxID=2864039 RepID=A0ABS7FUG7_9ACTN|nr:hypothetical protein [Actinomadura parmotrematis]